MCALLFETFSEVIDHCIIRHVDDKLKFQKLIRQTDKCTTLWQTKNFNIIPVEVQRSGSYIYSINDKETIKVAKLKDPLNDPSQKLTSTSSNQKKLKFSTSTPIKSNTSEPFIETKLEDNEEECDMSTDQLSEDFINLSLLEEENNDILTELTNLVPSVLDNLNSVNQLEK